MPVIDIPVADERESGRMLAAYCWGPRLRVDATRLDDGLIAVGTDTYNSTAAAFDGVSRPTSSEFALTGREYRNWVRRNPDLFLALIASIDAEIQARRGGTIVPATLPAWALEPEEPEPQPES